MKNILIICDFFPPAFGPRMGYLCNYLKSLGWNPIVITEKKEETIFTSFQIDCEVIYVNYYTASSPLLKKFQWIIIFILDLLFHYKDRKIIKVADQVIEHNKIDIVLCSIFKDFPLNAAYRVAKKYKLPLIVDLRDIIEQFTSNEFIATPLPKIFGIDKTVKKMMRNKMLIDRNKVLRKAAAITTISPWHQEVLSQYNPNVHLIYNGFDPKIFYPEIHNTEKFVITYTGRLWSLEMRDPSLLFEAIASLNNEGIISPKICRIQWYTDAKSQDIIRKAAKDMCILQYMDLYDMVDVKNIPSILNHSSILLLLTNKSSSNGPKGIMTTKFFESLATERPILCVRSDESYLAYYLQLTHAGIAARDVEETKEFLLKELKYWKINGYTHAEVVREDVNKFSREKQSEQFIQLFNSRINGK